MGKEEVVEDSDDEDSNSDKQASDIVYRNKTEEEDSESAEKPASEAENKGDNSSVIKEDTENLRKIIKVGSSEGENDAEPQRPKEKKVEPIEKNSELSSRESIEQKRAILQSIKDFDFQIKKNQEDLTLLNKKLDNVTKDLDDLVSLYEIVSEQMNPFVGLSKVTKKRIDALENFTKEIEILKERTGELESFAERSGAKLKKPKIEDLPDEKDNLDSDSETEDDELKSETELSEEEMDNEFSIELSTEEGQQPFSINLVDENGFSELSDSDWDIILERAFSDVIPDNKIDLIIDEFLESLKG